MRRQDGAALAPFRAFLETYNDGFYRRDLDALRALYAADGAIVYFDNHAGCDATDLEMHLAAIQRFFEQGKDTESGGVEPLAIEDLTAFEGAETAMMTATLRYASAPRPGVRASFFLERATGSAAGWRIRHIHCSFDPNEA